METTMEKRIAKTPSVKTAKKALQGDSEFREFMSLMIERNPGETEYIQAIEEVALSLVPFMRANTKYLNAKILERMCEPERVFIFRVPWMNDKCEYQVNRGFRVQMNSAIGAYKGGLRLHPTVNLSILKFLAFEQIFKNSLTGLPMGAGKGGSNFDPKGKSDNEVMRFCQSYMTELQKYIGHNQDIPAGDIGTGGREIGYLFGQYKRLSGVFVGVLTGKDLSYGGSLIRPEATGYGSVYFAEEMLKSIGESLSGKTCVVSGSGNVAQYTVQKVLQLGGKVVTLSDSRGFIYDKDGFDDEKLAFVMDLKNKKRGRISEYAEKYGVEYYEGKKPWSVPCEVAFPSATQNEISENNARELIKNGCKTISEGANMPSSPGAVQTFINAKVLYGPGKAANAGGVAVSGLEMAQNQSKSHWTREEVDNRLHDIMIEIHHKCVEYGKKDGFVNYVDGANIAGFVKVADAMLAQGLV